MIVHNGEVSTIEKMRSTRRALILGTCVSLLSVAPAVAATRYASPTGGTTEPCEQSNPCSLPHAIEAAKEGDEVIVLDGSMPYVVSGPISLSVPISIHGQAGAPIPEIDYVAKTAGLMLSAGASTVSRLRVVGTEPGLQLIAAGINGVLDDLLLEARASKETLATLSGATLRDSVLSSAGGVAEVTGISSGPSLGFGPATIVRNDTVEVLGSGSDALTASGFCFPSFTPPFIGCEPTLSSSSDFDVANAILRGGMWDVLTTGSGGYDGNVMLSHSNYRPAKVEALPGTLTDAGGNQTGVEPSLTADFHEQAGSATIDAGVADAHLGAQDPDGNARKLGAAPDIGAYEFVPPTPPPPPKPSSPSPPTVTVASAKAKGAIVSETVGCQGSPGQTCQIKIVLSTTERLLGTRLLSVTASSKKKHKHPRAVGVIVGSLTTTLQAGQVATPTVPLNKTGRALLARFHRLPVTVTTSLIDASGKASTVTKTKLTLKAPTKHKRRHK